MKELDISNYSKSSLEFIFSEADKMAYHILNSISEIRKKSFLLFALMSSVLSYSFIKTTENELTYLILIIGSLVSLLFLRKNLFPSKISFSGALPENLINEYFDNFRDEILEKEYLATQIQSYNSAMNKNKDLMEKMVGRFKVSTILMLISFLLFGFVYFVLLVECIPG